jgi:hypothetical protein
MNANEETRELARQAIVTAARGMLEGALSFIEGARIISGNRFDADLELDVDIRPFLGIDSSTDALPLGEARSLWREDALDRLQPEIDKAEDWARGLGAEHCRNLIRRFRVDGG